MGQYDIAMDFVNIALECDTKNFYAWSSRGEIYFHIGKYTDAINSLNYALNLNPESAFDYYFRGQS